MRVTARDTYAGSKINRVWWIEELGGIHWGFLPALLCLFVFIPAYGNVPMNLASLIIMASLMASYDLACRRIPNQLNAITALWGLCHAFAAGGLWGLGEAALAGVIIFAVMAVFFFMGAVGAGDVKALAALATLVGVSGAVSLLVLTLLAGGVLALIRMLVSGSFKIALVGGLEALRHSAKGTSLPYGLAIWAGAVALAALGG
jgi:prepilin peptidase CpaA